MFTWVLILAIGIVIGIAMGVYFMRLDDEAKRTQQKLQQQLETSKNELQLYKAEVQKSYMTTADLINNLTDSYKAVHQHLSQSATKLCGDVAPVNKLDLKDNVSYILPQPTSSASPQAASKVSKTQTQVEANAVDADPTEIMYGEDYPTELKLHADADADADADVGAYDEAALYNNDSTLTKTHAPKSEGVVANSDEHSSMDTQADHMNEADGSTKPHDSNPRKPNNDTTAAKLSPEEEEALQEKLKLEQARVEASRMIH